jgi:hypothetical protein
MSRRRKTVRRAATNSVNGTPLSGQLHEHNEVTIQGGVAAKEIWNLKGQRRTHA